MEVDEFKAANTRYIVVLISLLLSFAGLILWTPALEDISTWVKSFEQLPIWVYENLPLIEIALIFFPIFWISSNFAAKCRECGKVLSPQQSDLVISTKNCPNCGERALN